LDENTWIAEKAGYTLTVDELKKEYSNLILEYKVEKNKKPKTLIQYAYIIKDSIVEVPVNIYIDSLGNKSITFNFVSSGFVYGQEVVNAKETDSCNPRGFYSVTKLAAEQLLITFCETFDIKYRIFRLSNVYGNDKNRSIKKNVLGYIIDRLKCNEEVNLYNYGQFKRDFIFVDDVCHAFNYLIQNSKTNEIYNISNGIPVEFKYPVEYCKKILNSKSKINYLSNRVPDYYLNNSKIVDLGYKSSISLEDGLNLLCS
jgi:nucleoside-diphosphate-sugar epimerase